MDDDIEFEGEENVSAIHKNRNLDESEEENEFEEED